MAQNESIQSEDRGELWSEPERAVARLQEKFNISDRGQAIKLLKDLYDEKKPNVTKIAHIGEFLQQNVEESGPARRFLGHLARPMANAVDLAQGEYGSPNGVAGLINKYIRPDESVPTGVSIPSHIGPVPVPSFLGSGQPLGDVLGDVLGLGPEFSGLEALAEKPATFLAGRAAGLVPRLIDTLREPIETFAGKVPSAVEKYGKELGRVPWLADRFSGGAAGAGVGAINDPEHPIRGAAVGAGLGAGLPFLARDLPEMFVRKQWAKLVGPDFLSKDAGKKAFEGLARLRHTSPEGLLDEYIRNKKTLGDVQADLAKAQQPPLDPMHFASSDEIQEAFPGMTRPARGPVLGSKAWNERGGLFVGPPRPVEPLPKTPFQEPQMSHAESRESTFRASREGIVGRGIVREPVAGSPFSKLESPLQTSVAGPPSFPEAALAAQDQFFQWPYEAPDEVPNIPPPVESSLTKLHDLFREQTKSPKEQARAEWLSQLSPLGVLDKLHRGTITQEEANLHSARRQPEAPTSQTVPLEQRKEVLNKQRKKTKKLLNERGAISFGVKPKPDYDALSKEFGLTDTVGVYAGMDAAPDETLGKEIKAGIEANGPGILKYIRPTMNVFARHPSTSKMWLLNKTAEARFVLKGGAREARHVNSWAKDISVEDSQAAYKAAMSLRLGPDGKYTQIAEGVDPKANENALKLRKMKDHLWVVTHGYEPVVSPIIRQYGLIDNAATILRLKAFQEDSSIPEHQNVRDAAEATLGMIHSGQTHDLSHPYTNTFYHHIPLAEAEVILRKEMAEAARLKQMHGTSDERIAELDNDIAIRQKLIENATKEIEARTNPAPGDLDLQKMGQHAGSGKTLEFQRSIQVTSPETIPQLWNRVAMRDLTNRFHNVVLHNGWEALREVGEDTQNGRLMSHYIRHYVNTVRGIKGVHDNAWLVRSLREAFGTKAMRKLFPKAQEVITEDYLQELMSTVLKLRATFALNFSPRFPIENSLQTLQTLWPITGTKTYVQAYLKTARDFGDFFAERKMEIGGQEPSWKDNLRRSHNIWWRALADGDIDFNSERWVRDAEALSQQHLAHPHIARMSRMAESLASNKKNPFLHGSILTEDFNRVISKAAGEILADDPSFNPRILKGFVEPKKLLSDMQPGRKAAVLRRHLMGKAMIESTQFGMGKTAKPTAFSGGIWNQGVGQFQTFGIAYTELFKDAIIEARHGNVKPIARMLVSTYMMTGLASIPAFSTFKNYAMRKWGLDLPDSSGTRLAWNSTVAAMGAPGTPPPFGVDLSYPLNAFPDYFTGSVLERLAGPAAPLIGIATTTHDKGLISPQTARTALRSTMMSAFPPLDAFAEYMSGGLKQGHETIAKRSGWQLAGRALNVQPAVSSHYYDYAQKIQAAIQGRRPDIVKDLIEQAKAEGLRFPQADLNKWRTRLKGKKPTVMNSIWESAILGRRQ